MQRAASLKLGIGDRSWLRLIFPYLEEHTYLNTAAAGLSWVGQGTAPAAFYDSVKSMGMQGAGAWRERAQLARSHLGQLLSVSTDAIEFVGSTTEGLNLVASSLPLNPGDRVVLAADEFPSVSSAFAALGTQGIAVHPVTISEECNRTEALCEALEHGVQALAVSHIHWRTGTRVDLERLSRRCRELDCWLVVDGVQAVGAVPVQAKLADAYCASVFKWLLSGFGLGFVTLSDRLASKLRPMTRGYANEPPSRQLGYGHVNYPGIYALEASLRFLSEIGWSDIFAKVDQLATRTTRRLLERGYTVVTPEDARGGIVSIRHPEASRIVEALATESVFVEDRGEIIRIAPHFYNDWEDIERLERSLGRLTL